MARIMTLWFVALFLTRISALLSVEEAIRLGITASEQGQHNEAIELLTQVSGQSPDARLALAVSLHSTRRSKQANTLLRRLCPRMSSLKKRVQCHETNAQVAVALGRPASPELQAALVAAPDLQPFYPPNVEPLRPKPPEQSETLHEEPLVVRIKDMIDAQTAATLVEVIAGHSAGATADHTVCATPGSQLWEQHFADNEDTEASGCQLWPASRVGSLDASDSVVAKRNTSRLITKIQNKIESVLGTLHAQQSQC